MFSNDSDLTQARKLREYAEQLSKEKASQSKADVESLSPDDIVSLVHELQVHQIELEIQNDELRRTQEELEINRTKYFELYNRAPVGYVTLNEKGIITEVNLTTSTLLGHTRQDIIKHSFSKFIFIEDQDIFYKYKKNLLDSGAMHVCVLRLVKQGGKTFWVRLEASKEYNHQINEFNYFCCISNISDEKKQEQLLAEQHRLLQALINSPEGLIFSLDREGHLTAFNQNYREQMQQLWHKEIKEGDKIMDNMSPAEAATFKRNMERVLSGERFVNLIQEPPDIYFEMDWIPIHDDKMAVIGFTVFLKDISERKQAEQIIKNNNVFLEQKVKERTNELAVARNELEAFSASIAHDLSDSLRIIDGFVHIILEDYDAVLDDEAKNLLHVIRTNVLKLDGFVDALLNVARIARSDVNQSIVNNKKLVNQTWQGLATVNSSFIFVIPPDLPDVIGDFRLIQVVWQNLLSNAVKFTRRQPTRRITISSITKGDFVEFAIEDTGVGFDMKDYDKLFHVFHKLHNVKDYEGTGIGLSVVQRIVKMHGGQVWATSEVGKGATFYFTLPVVV